MDRDLAARYLWNVALAESLLPCLQFVEVTLRNAIHHAGCNMGPDCTPVPFQSTERERVQ